MKSRFASSLLVMQAGLVGICAITLGLSGCASLGILAPTDERLKRVQTTSCERPMIKQLTVRQETWRALDPQGDIQKTYVQEMGFNTVARDHESICTDPSIAHFKVGMSHKEASLAPSHSLYIKFMTEAEIKADPTIKCRPTFTQTYQPAFKLGGSGRVISVPNGKKCDKILKLKRPINN